MSVILHWRKALPVLVAVFLAGPWISSSLAQQDSQQPDTDVFPDTLASSSPLASEIPKSPALAVDSVNPGRAGLGERIRVRVEGLSEGVETGDIDPGAFVLYLAGRPLPGLHPVGVAGLQEVNPRFGGGFCRDLEGFDGVRAELDFVLGFGIPNIAPWGFRDAGGWIEATGSWSDYRLQGAGEPNELA
jgi:hypothetical protein